MKSSNKSNLGLSENEFFCLQHGEENLQYSERLHYRHLTQQVVREIKYVLNSTLYQLTSDSNDAEELLANTIEKFWHNLPNLKYGYLNAWLTTVCRNLHISDYRKSSKIQLIDNWSSSDLDFGQPAESERSLWDDKQKQESVIAHLFEQVDEDRRSILEAHYLEDQSIKGLAQDLNLKPNTLTRKIIRIIDNLRPKAKML